MKVAKYILSVFLIIGGFGFIAKGNIISGLFTLILGGILLPPVSEKIKEQVVLFKNKIIRYGVYFLLMTIAGSFITKSDAEILGSKEDVLINYIKNNKTDKSLQNIKSLAEIGSMFKNNNYSLRNPHDGYISEQYDSIKKVAVLTFNPKFDYNGSDDISFLKDDAKNGKLKAYTLQYEIDEKDSITLIKTTITYSKIIKEFLSENDVPNFKTFINEEVIANQEKVIEEQKMIKEAEALAEKQKEEYNKRAKKFKKNCFNPWNGSHTLFSRYVKERLNDPNSFEHVTTTYKLYNGFAIINMTFRGKNAFNATVTNKMSAKVSLKDCSIIEVYEK